MHKTPNALNIICHLKLQSAEKQATHHSVGLISIPTGRFTAVASLSHRKHSLRCRVSGQQMFLRESVVLTQRQQKGFILCESLVNVATATAPMLVTKALSQDVMVLAFVPLFADPQGIAQPQLQSTYILLFNNCHP